MKKSGAFRQAIFNFAYEYKLKWTKRGYETPLFNKYIFAAAKQVLGGYIRLVLSGGAPLSPDTHNQVKLCLCVTVTQGYGLTETSSCATVMDGMCLVRREMSKSAGVFSHNISCFSFLAPPLPQYTTELLEESVHLPRFATSDWRIGRKLATELPIIRVHGVRS